MQRRHALAWVAWSAVVAAAVLLLARGLELRYDLTLFLPSPSDPEQALLFERLGEGPGSRLLTVAISGADVDELARVREVIAAELSANPGINRVLTDPAGGATLEPPEPLWRYRYLLADQRFDAESLHQALQARMGDLSLMGGDELRRLIAADPTLTLLDIVERLAPVQAGGDGWQMADGTALAVVETVAPAFEMNAQESAVAAIEVAFERAQPPPEARLEISGPGAFGVGLQGQIRREATRRSTLATVAVVMVLVIAYRRARPVLLGALPLLTGALAGLAGVAVLFDGVHGITLAFGFTLLGVAIDYPLHLFSHARHASGDTAIRAVGPTLMLGAASTAVAYLALALGGSVGLAQLGVFTALGVAAAVLTTRFLLPPLLRSTSDEPASTPVQLPGLRWWPILVLAAAAGVLVLAAGRSPWNDNLAALSPVPAATLQRDAQFRAVLGAPEMRYAVVLSDAEQDAVLEQTEAAAAAIAASEAVDGYLAATHLLPAPSTQQRRRDALPSADTLRASLTTAAADTPFRPSAFEPFVAAVEASGSLPVLTADDYAGTPMGQLLSAHLYRSQEQWVSLISLHGLTDSERLRLSLPPTARLVDFRDTSEQLVADYRQRTWWLLAAAGLVIMLLLVWRFDRRRAAAWVMLTVMVSMAATLALLALLLGSLNLYHLVAIVLVGGLGLDYALFASRAGPAAERRDTWHALTACAASTAVAFGVLAFSTIPVLQAIGATVALGCVLAYTAARLGTTG